MLAHERRMIAAHRRASLTVARPEFLSISDFKLNEVAATVGAVRHGVLAEANGLHEHAFASGALNRFGELFPALNLNHGLLPFSFGVTD
jgi:hypothetical protein